MTGPEKLAATLLSAIVTLTALTAAGQQPSGVPQGAQQEASPSPMLPVARRPADMPPNPPKVTCEGGQLTISAQNSTLGSVLNAVHTCIGSEIDVPEAARGERLFAELGPGPARSVLAEFLSSTDFNYVIKSSPTDPQKVQTVLLNPRVNDSPADALAEVANKEDPSPNRRAWLEARHNYSQSFATNEDESSHEAEAPSSSPVESAAAPANSIPVEAAPADPVPAAEAAVAPRVGNGFASAAAQAPAALNQGKSTSEMIGDMQRMFEQRKLLTQQQTAPAH